MSNRNFYDEKLMEIKRLISEKEYKKAQTLLNEELKMPYIPEIYERQFKKLSGDVAHHLISTTYIASAPSLDEIMILLKGNDKEQTIALELIGSHNLRPVASDLKNIIESWESEKNFSKSFLFETLAEQEIDINIRIGDRVLNPKEDSILLNDEVMKAFSEVDHKVEQEPQIKELALHELRRYLLLTFPIFPYDGEKLGMQIVNYVKSLLIPNFILTNDEKEVAKILK